MQGYRLYKQFGLRVPTLAKFKIYGYFLQNFRGPAQNLGAVGYWAPVSLFPCSMMENLQ